jgi:hypothetical protein
LLIRWSTIRIMDEPLQITPICGHANSSRQVAKLVCRYKSARKCDLLRAADKQALPMLNRSDELRGFEADPTKVPASARPAA